tara:strand:- start:1201 stop:1515 length:315 start_codon:yes stop_codon:yes gene_type:complete
MCRASLIPKPEDRHAAGGGAEFENSRNREQQGTTSLFQGSITAEEDRREAIETASRYRTGERPVNISWSVNRNPDHDIRYFDEEGNLRRREEFIRDISEEEVGF